MIFVRQFSCVTTTPFGRTELGVRSRLNFRQLHKAVVLSCAQTLPHTEAIPAPCLYLLQTYDLHARTHAHTQTDLPDSSSQDFTHTKMHDVIHHKRLVPAKGVAK